MKTHTSYYLILFVYISLWTCQLVTSHLTHSLIILTDSYINLFRILDILLGLLHLRTQSQLARNSAQLQPRDEHKTSKPWDRFTAGSMFQCVCSFQFKRLPVLGNFVNDLFLMALLLSAAIEGMQTCLHVDHSGGGAQATILTENPLTYPLTLIGFAIVGLVMHYCSLKAHELRDEELCSESVLDLRQARQQKQHVVCNGAAPLELDAAQLEAAGGANLGHQQVSQANGVRLRSHQKATAKKKKYNLNLISHISTSSSGCDTKQASCEVPDSRDECVQRISMRSLNDELDEPVSSSATETELDLEARSTIEPTAAPVRDKAFWVSYLSSPLALVTCALIILLADDSWLTEISDATLALLVVISYYVASYAPIKRTGKVLLQKVPDNIDLVKLEQRVKESSSHIAEVRDLHVWSLTGRSSRVATCGLLLSVNKVSSQMQVAQILHQAKYAFSEYNIKCTTIEPIISKQATKSVVASTATANSNDGATADSEAATKTEE